MGDSSAVLVLIPAPAPVASPSDASTVPPPATGNVPVPDPTDGLAWKPLPNSAGAGVGAAVNSGAVAGAAGTGGFGGAARWIKLTADHRIANSANERQRLQQRGHTVKTRLYGLNISRMLGDKCVLIHR